MTTVLQRIRGREPRPVFAAIVGAGNIAAKHAKAYRDLRGAVQIRVVVDLNLPKARQFAEEHHRAEMALRPAGSHEPAPLVPKCFGSIDALVEAVESGGVDVDVVHVCTQNRWHEEIAVKALRAGLHVALEKPMAIDLAGALRIQSAAEEAGKHVMLGFHYRKQHPYLQRFLDAGAMGTIYFGVAEWPRQNGVPGWGPYTNKAEQGGGAFIDIGIHPLYEAWRCMGRPEPIHVSAVASDHNREVEVEVEGIAFITFKNGAALIVRAAWVAATDKSESVRVILHGTKVGSPLPPALDITYSTTQEPPDEFDPKEFRAQFLDDRRRWIPLPEAAARLGIALDERQREPVPVSACYLAEAEELVEVVRGSQEPSVPLSDGIAVQRMLDGFYRSVREGRPVSLAD